MSLLSLIKPIIGQPDATQDVKIVNAFTAIEAWANGQIDSTNLKGEGVLEAAIAKGAVSEAKLSAAVQALLNAKVSGLAVNLYKGVVAQTLKGGEFFVTTNGINATLPETPVAGMLVGAYNASAGPSKVAVGAKGTISGDFVHEAGAVFLARDQHIVLIGDGENWRVFAGEPKLETKYSARAEIAFNALTAISPYRPASLVVDVEVQPSAGSGNGCVLMVGGNPVAEFFAAEGGKGVRFSTSVRVMPGEKWEVKYEGEKAGSKCVGLHFSFREE